MVDEVELGAGVELGLEDSVTPCAELGEMKKETVDKVLSYHGATHFNSGGDGLGQVIAGTVGLEANGGLVDEVLVLAQALGIIGSA